MTALFSATVLVLSLFFLFTVNMGRLELAIIRNHNNADVVSLSTARIASQHLNILATQNTVTSLFFMGIKIGKHALMPLEAKTAFEIWHKSKLIPGYIGYLGRTMSIGSVVAKANGGHTRPVPLFERANILRLKQEPLKVHFFKGYIYAGSKRYDNAYYSRLWTPGQRAAQPVHKFSYLINGQNSITGYNTPIISRAKVWLDIKNGSGLGRLNNGGFPRADNKGDMVFIQSRYPQFNARLVLKNEN